MEITNKSNRQGRNLLAYAQMNGLELLRTGDLEKPLGINAKQERELFSRMSRRGLIIRLLRGAYLVPMTMPPGGIFAASEYKIISQLMKSVGGRYQICGPNAFNYYGFSEQLPNRTYVYNNKFSGDRKIGGLQFTFIKLQDRRLGGEIRRKMPEGMEVMMSGKARTLIDALDDYDRFCTIPQAYKWILDEIKKDAVLLPELCTVAEKYARQGTLRRLGWLLSEKAGEEKIAERLLKRLTSKKTVFALLPGLPMKGSINSKWGIMTNGRF